MLVEAAAAQAAVVGSSIIKQPKLWVTPQTVEDDRELEVELQGGFRLPAFLSTPERGREPPAELPAAPDGLRQRDARGYGSETIPFGKNQFQAR